MGTAEPDAGRRATRYRARDPPVGTTELPGSKRRGGLGWGPKLVRRGCLRGREPTQRAVRTACLEGGCARPVLSVAVSPRTRAPGERAGGWQSRHSEE